MKLSNGNLFGAAIASPVHDAQPGDHERSEQHDALYMSSHVRVMRIESSSHTSTEGFWYDQPDDEWVAVVAGDAVIEFDDGTRHPMGAGDWVVIPAHCRHRVAETGEKTIWLAVYGGARLES